MKYRPLDERFHEKYSINVATGCWDWVAFKDKKGYGRITVGDSSKGSHRVSYELMVGAIGNNHVLHVCDNPSCVNPEHLFLGSNQDNVDDKVLKGRQCSGESVNHAKLTRTEVNEIRLKYEFRAVSQRALAREYGVSQHSIWKIVNLKTWAN